MSTSFKTSMFGGFDRSDVIAYIEKTGREHEERVAALEAENETLRKENQTLENTQRVTQAQLLKMRDNEETCRRLRRQLADVEARNQELEQRCAQLKVQADEYESLKDHVAQIEISAHRRTEQFREEAVTRLRQLAARQREWCRTAQADYEQMNCQLLERLQQAEQTLRQLCQDPAEAARLARELCALNRERQAVEQTIYAQAVEQIDHLPLQERSALVLASDTWHQGVVGIVASRLSEKYACPSFMIHLNGTVGKGSCRSWGGFNLFAALERCSDLLLDFGGHELAAGFTIDVANIPAFRQRMNQLVREYQGGGAPEVCLEIDAALTCPSRVTLTEVEALGMLEPYGAGNNRPLFCLMGATLERLQSVGQNRHLKLRLSKGSSQFDGIFFSVSPDTCPVAAGSRVDAAFYLQINEFRGNRTVQLQMVDIRPSLTVSTREDECLHLLERCLRGDRLLPKEAVHLLPSRSQCVQLWRALEHTVPPEGLTACYLPLLRELSARLEGADPFLRTAFCLEVFRERQLLTLRQEGDTISITLTGQGKHVRLEESGYLQGLHEVMQPKRGGDHHD